MSTTISFGDAIEAAKQGKKIARKGWNGSNMFAVYSQGKKSLPAKDFFSPNLQEYAEKIGGFMDVRPSLMLKTAQDDVAYWSPSTSDTLADDWFVVD